MSRTLIFTPWRTSSGIWATSRALALAEELSAWELAAVVPSAIRMPTELAMYRPLRAEQGLVTLRDSAALIVPGGTIGVGGFRSQWAPFGPLAMAAKMSGRIFAAMGVGMTLRGGRRPSIAARALATRPDLLLVRSEATARTFARAGAPPPFRVGADPLWLALRAYMKPSAGRKLNGPTSNGAGGSSSGATNGSTVRSDSVMVAGCLTDETMRPLLAMMLTSLAAQGLRPRVQLTSSSDRAFQPNGCAQLTEAIASRVRGTQVIEDPWSLEQAVEQAKASRLVVALDWPAACVAAVAGTPFVAATEDPDVASLTAALGQVGVLPQSGVKALVTAALSALNGPPADPSAIASQVHSAKEGVRLLKLLLVQGREGDVPSLDALPMHPEPWAS